MKARQKTFFRSNRVFSESIRKQIVEDIEAGKTGVTAAARELSVDRKTIYKWIYKYSRYLQKDKILVVEEKSEAYRSKELERKILELEAALGRKQMEIDFLNKMIDLAGEHYHVDLKKTLKPRLSGGSENKKDKPTGTK